MDWLPPLRHGATQRWLPLIPSTATRLFERLLLESGDAASHFADSLSIDPAFLLWSYVRGRELGLEPPRTIHQLAVWLSAPRLLEMLRWCETPCRPPASNHERFWQRFALLAEDSFLAAARVAKPNPAFADDPEVLAAMVRSAAAWFPAGEENEQGGIPLSLLPEWLRAESNEGPPSSVELPKGTTVASLRNELRRAWAPANGNPVGRWLPPFVEQLRQLRQLQHEFDAAVQREKLSAMKALAYGASHEINNPLANIATRAQSLLRDETDPQRQRQLATINQQAFRAHEMIADMMLFAHPPQLKWEQCDVTELLAELVNELQPLADAQGTRFVLADVNQVGEISADRTQLTVALKAVCMNALEAVDEGGCVEITVSRPSPDGRPDELCVRVTDDGPGIPLEMRRCVFDPFFSGREAGRGLGFGLSKAWRIIDNHGGEITVDDASGGGTIVCLHLPVTSGSQ